MKSVNNIIALCCYVILGVLFAGSEVSAAESSDGWRPLYDEILLWIYFGIIVFLFVAYSSFLRRLAALIIVDINAILERLGWYPLCSAVERVSAESVKSDSLTRYGV